MALPEQALIDRLDGLDMALDRLRAELPAVTNQPRLHDQITLVIATTAAMLTQHGAEPQPAVADELDRLLAGLHHTADLARDADLGLLASREGLEAATGILVSRAQAALNAAKAIGWVPQAPQLPSRIGAEIPRDEIAVALPHIQRRLNELTQSLDALVAAQHEDNHRPPQRVALVNFYVNSMKVEINLARMALTFGDTRIDISALLRASEAMGQMTGDFIATVRGWVGQISRRIADAAEKARFGLRKAVRTISATVRMVVWKRGRTASLNQTLGPITLDANAENRSAEGRIIDPVETIQATGTIGPPPDFSNQAAEDLIGAGQAPPASWRPFITQLGFGGYGWTEDGRLDVRSAREDFARQIDLRLLTGLPGLQRLALVGMQVTDLSPLAGLPALQQLFLHGTPVTDLSPLAGLPALQVLYLHGTKVTDLSPLAGLPALQVLSLDGTQVTAGARRAFIAERKRRGLPQAVRD